MARPKKIETQPISLDSLTGETVKTEETGRHVTEEALSQVVERIVALESIVAKIQRTTGVR